MNNNSWKIDPTKGDYVMQGGSPTIDAGLLTPAYFRLRIHRTKWMYAPDNNYGSDFYSVRKRHVTADFRLMESIADQALQPLIDQGRASSVQNDLSNQTRSAIQLETKIVDVAGEPITIKINPIGL